MPTAYYCTYDPMMSSSIWILGCMTSVCIMLQAPPGSEYAERREELETALNVLTSCLSGFSDFWSISKKMLGKCLFPRLCPHLLIITIDSLESLRGWNGLGLELGEILFLLKRFLVPLPVHDTSAEDLYDVDVVEACKISFEKSSSPLPG